MKKILSLILVCVLLISALPIGISVSATELQSGDKEQFYLSDVEARCFIGFLYNKNDLSYEQLYKYDMYKLLTGQLSGEEEFNASAQFLELMNAQLSRTVDTLDYINGYSSDYLIDYLSTFADSNLAEDIIEEVFHGIGDNFMDYLFDEYTIHGGSLCEMEYEYFQDGLLAWDIIKQCNSIPEKVEEYKKQMLGLANAVFYVSSTNKTEMYQYFLTYKDNLCVKYNLGEDAFELILDTNRVYNEILILIQMLEPTLADWDFLDKNMLLWATEERIALIEKWAEFTYLLEENVKDYVVQNYDESTTADVSIHYSLIPKSSLEYSIVDNYAYIDKYNGNLIAPMIPYEIDGFYVKGIRDNAFSENVNMRYLYIPGTVNLIGSKAFLNCFNLREVYMPNGNTVIDDDAFNAYVYNLIDDKEYILDTSLDVKMYSTTGSEVERYCNNKRITLNSLDWDGEENKKPCLIHNTIYVGCAAEYMWLREQSLSSLKGKNIVMSGVFNFNSKGINNEYITKDKMLECNIHIVSAEINDLNCYNYRNYGYQVNGLFPSASVEELSVVDVVINNPDVTQSTTIVDSCYDGALFGNLEIKSGGNARLDNIKISGGKVYADQGFTGGLVGNLVVNSNAQVSVSDIYTNYSLGGDVEYMETMSAGGLIGRFVNYGDVSISRSNIMGDFKSYGGYNTWNQSHPGRVGGLISDVYNYGELQINEIDVNISAGTSGGNYSTTHYIGAILSYVIQNSGNIQIKNIKANINFSKGLLNGFVGGGTFNNVRIDESIFINSGSQYSINTDYLSCVNNNFTNSYYLSDKMYLYNPTSGSYYTSEEKVLVNNILSKGKTLDELINDDLYQSWDTDKVWLVDGESLPSLKFSYNESVDYYISVVRIKDGVSTCSTTFHNSGDDYTCKFTAYEGYSINKVMVDDIYIGSLSSYSFSNINKNHEVKVYYEPFTSATINDITWKYKLVDDQAYIYEYESKLSDISIPTNINGYNVAGFLGSTFSYKSGLVRVTIPDNITKIESSAFSGCSDLTEISIGKNISYIGERAFHSCYNLAKVYYNNTTEKWKNIKVLDYNQSLNNATVVCTDGTIYPPKIESGNKVYFDNSLTKWDVVYCYMWEGDNTFNNNTWPGEKMTYLEDNIWYYTLPDNYKNIIFTNGSQQSKDLSYPGDNYIATPILNSNLFDVSWKQSEYNVFEIGDVNTDEQIDIKDVTCIQKHIVESEIIPKENLTLCDVDKNNSIDIKDATKLQLIIAGVI